MCSARYSKGQTKALKRRWEGQGARIAAIVADLRAGRDWTRHLRESKKGGWKVLPLLHTCPSRFRVPWDDAPRDLRGLRLCEVDLRGSDKLANTCLDMCEFRGVNLRRASLKGTSFHAAEFGVDCVLDAASLHFADLYHSDLSGVSLEGADLILADIRGADFRDSVLIGARLSNVKLSREKALSFIIPWRLRKWLGWPRWTRFGGRFQSTLHLGTTTDSSVCNYISGENLRWSISKDHRILEGVWYVLANCGRSPARLLFWTFVTVICFGLIYAGYPVPSFLQGTLLGDLFCCLSPHIDWGQNDQPNHWFEPFYFSVVTLSTLGFGDIGPRLGDWKGEFYVCVEVLLGYIMMSMLISIFMQAVSVRKR